MPTRSCFSCKHASSFGNPICNDCLTAVGHSPSKWEGRENYIPVSPEEEAPIPAILPSHYPPSRHGDVISLCLNGDIGFCEGNVIKYVTRWRKKGGLEDLLKAKQYLDRLIRFNRNKDPQ